MKEIIQKSYSQLKSDNETLYNNSTEYKTILRKIKELDNIKKLTLQYYGFENELNCFCRFLLYQLKNNHKNINEIVNPNKNKFMLFISKLNHPIRDEVVLSVIFSLCMKEDFDLQKNNWLFNEPFWFNDFEDSFSCFFEYINNKKLDFDFSYLDCDK